MQLLQGYKSCVDVLLVAGLHHLNALADGAGTLLDVVQPGLEGRISRIEKDADERGSGQQFAQ